MKSRWSLGCGLLAAVIYVGPAILGGAQAGERLIPTGL